MTALLEKIEQRTRRRMRVRKKVFGTPERPRLSVFRSLKHIYAQLIDDVAGHTLVEASTRDRDFPDRPAYAGNKAAAAQVGRLLAERARARGISQAAFDRNGYKFHGRVKALAEAVREAGLKL
jgi:large subunit ribosomal protein L18